MQSSPTTARLHELSQPLASLLRRALERSTELASRSRTPDERRDESALYREAFAAVGLASADPSAPPRRMLPRPASLTSEQRTVLEIVAHVPGPDLAALGVPGALWARRQWLGLEPPGPLLTVEVDGEPAWVAIEQAGSDALALIEALPIAEAIAVAVEVQLLMFQLACGPMVGGLLTELAPRATADMAPWARQQADRWLALFAPDVPGSERGDQARIPEWVKLPMFLALARAKVPVEPRWEALLPAAPSTAPSLLRECIEALDATRREPALLSALSAIDAPRSRADVALAVVAIHPTRTIARALLDVIDHASKPKEAGKTLRALAAKHPEVARALDGASDSAEPVALTVASVREAIRLESLDASDRAQLERANELYGGRREPVEALFEDAEPRNERIQPQLTRALRIERQGRPAYDAWLYMGDSGTVFEAGTTRVVAEVVQGHLECGDEQLLQSLRDVLASAPRRASAGRRLTGAKKTSVKKTSAKKTSVKKTSVKKTSAKKTSAKKTSAKKTSVKKTSVKKTSAKKMSAKKSRA